MEEKNELEHYSESKSETVLCESRARSEIKEQKNRLKLFRESWFEEEVKGTEI